MNIKELKDALSGLDDNTEVEMFLVASNCWQSDTTKEVQLVMYDDRHGYGRVVLIPASGYL